YSDNKYLTPTFVNFFPKYFLKKIFKNLKGRFTPFTRFCPVTGLVDKGCRLCNPISRGVTQ
ncbi:MAG TPA: hypothetical protein PLV17_10640, partial [Spirochaetota bacterium]|nr:hypothetical protein [Spirochaetota bacterium]HPW51905.1 hypothetical protein [Spirochaetota bacterium]